MTKKDEFAINWMTNPEKDVVKEPDTVKKKFSDGWNSDFGVWSVPRVAEYAKTSLDNSGFKTGKVEMYDTVGKTLYSFKIDLTSMFKAK